MKMNKEVRYVSFDDFHIREDENKQPRLVGYASVFNKEAEIYGLWREKVAAGAYKKTIKENDIRALWNHNTDLVLGRNKNGTLNLLEDSKGLKVEIIPPDTQAGRDAVTSIKRGDVNQMSIAFQIIKQEWQESTNSKELPLRTIREAKLFEVSPVAFPAFEQTSIAARSAIISEDGEIEIDPLEEARRLLRCAERGMELTTEQREQLSAAVELFKPYIQEPEIEPDEDESDHSRTSDEPEPDDGHYSAMERQRLLESISREQGLSLD